jgi:MSHA pilin protein MshA
MLQIPTAGRSGQQGFTLIEIIAVLVILGILAVVAVPKYYDLQEEARKSAAKGLIAAAQSQLSMTYAARLLNSTVGGATPQAECANVNVGNATNYYLNCGTGDWNASITITANVDDGTNVIGYWNSPGAAVNVSQ